MRKINILGISLTDCTLRESLAKMNLFMQSGALNSVLYLNTPMLMAANQSEKLRSWVEEADMTVCGDLSILWGYGITSVARVRETQNFTFLKETLDKLTHTGNTVYLVADSQEALERLEKDIRTLQPGLAIQGGGIFEEDDNINDATINEINAIVPTVILLRASYSFARRLMVEDKDRINAEVVIAFPKELNILKEKESVPTRLVNRVFGVLFRRRVARYEQTQNDQNSQKSKEFL